MVLVTVRKSSYFLAPRVRQPLCSAKRSRIYGVWAGSSKTMGWCWGWVTAVGGSETDCDPPAQRLSASHGPRDAGDRRERADYWHLMDEPKHHSQNECKSTTFRMNHPRIRLSEFELKKWWRKSYQTISWWQNSVSEVRYNFKEARSLLGYFTPLHGLQ